MLSLSEKSGRSRAAGLWWNERRSAARGEVLGVERSSEPSHTVLTRIPALSASDGGCRTDLWERVCSIVDAWLDLPNERARTSDGSGRVVTPGEYRSASRVGKPDRRAGARHDNRLLDEQSTDYVHVSMAAVRHGRRQLPLRRRCDAIELQAGLRRCRLDNSLARDGLEQVRLAFSPVRSDTSHLCGGPTKHHCSAGLRHSQSWAGVGEFGGFVVGVDADELWLSVVAV